MTRLQGIEANARRAWPPLGLALVLVVTWVFVDRFADIVYTQITMTMFVNLILVLGLQIFSGNSGVLSFGHVAFMAVGAYTSALLTIPTEIKKFTFLTMPHFLSSWVFPAHLGPIEATLAGAGFATLFALVVAPPIVRLAGVQAGIGTLAILVIVYTFITQATSITRGTSTMIGVPGTTTLTSLLVWALIVTAIAFVFQQSRRGLRLRATRENDRAAKSVGISVPLERAAAFVVSGFVVGVGGALYAHYITAFSPSSFWFDITFLTVAMLVVGGMTSVTGAVVGVYLLTIVNEAVRRIEVNGIGGAKAPSGTANLVVALVLLVALILRPKGLMGGRELPWPGDLRFTALRRLARGDWEVLVPARYRTVRDTTAPVPETAGSANVGAAPAADVPPRAQH